MKIIQISDGIIFIPHDIMETFPLWLLSKFCGEYTNNCCNPEAYPTNRRLKIYVRNGFGI